jgi:ferredoxin
MSTVQKRFLLNFSKQVSEQPHVYHLVKDYDLVINIFRAKITDQEEGFMVLEISGEESSLEAGIAYLKSQNVQVDEAAKGLRWNRDICTHCGNCLSHCPTGALFVADKTSMRIDFDSDKCIDCLACIKNCPYGACSSVF